MSSSRPLIICTARYSDNLGDGVIGECIEHLIHKICPNIKTLHFDLAGRSDYAEDHFRKANTYKNIFYRLPYCTRFMAVLASWPFLMRPKLKKAWNEVVPNDNFNLVFGGGQLLSDVALNFPLKFVSVTKKAEKHNSLIAVNAVGVSKKWSPIARALFRQSLSSPNIVSISVRDKHSFDNLNKHLHLEAPTSITIDPAIFASELYDFIKVNSQKTAKIRIGIGIAHPHELATQAENPKDFDIDSALQFWADIINGVKLSGHTPVLFTNGAFEDEDFLRKVYDYLKGQVEYLPRPDNPQTLVKNISIFNGIISHRLHANIIAYSIGIPSVSLVWDSKIRSFAKISNREKWCLGSNSSPTEIVDCLNDTLKYGVDSEKLSKLKCIVERDVRKLLHNMNYI